MDSFQVKLVQKANSYSNMNISFIHEYDDCLSWITRSCFGHACSEVKHPIFFLSIFNGHFVRIITCFPKSFTGDSPLVELCFPTPQTTTISAGVVRFSSTNLSFNSSNHCRRITYAVLKCIPCKSSFNSEEFHSIASSRTVDFNNS